VTTDPFDALRQPDVPVAPPAAFAAELRRRLEGALGMTHATTTAVTTHVTPYLAVNDGRRALEFYEAAFGAVETNRIVMDDGRIGHAEFSIGEAAFMLADEFPEIGHAAPTTLGGSGVSLHLEVPDVDRMHEHAVAAGATSQRAPEDQAHGNRNAVVVDPFGHRWMLSTPLAPRARRIPDGWIGYFTLNAPDSARTRAFYGGLFGWRFETGGVADGFHIANVTPPGGLQGNRPTGLTLYFTVPEIGAAVARVRELGGTATDPVHYDSGWNASCEDDQGFAFDLFEPRPGYEP
jgi:uncharacterized glyoxalase superfamily protein PhnB